MLSPVIAKKVLWCLIPNIIVFAVFIPQTGSQALEKSVISVQDTKRTSGLGRGPKLELVATSSTIFIGYIGENSLIFDILNDNLLTTSDTKLEVSIEQFKNEKLEALLDFEVQQKKLGWRVYLSTLMKVGVDRSCNSIRLMVVDFSSEGDKMDEHSKTISDCIRNGNLLLSGGGLAYERLKSTVYVGIGDFGQSGSEIKKYRSLTNIIEANISKNGTIGKIRSFSSGHRNPLDLMNYGKEGDLLEVESGPFGGDELNRIALGKNYGWPHVTLGEPYNNDNDYIQEIKYQTHLGYTKPLYWWKQSQTPTAISSDKQKFNCIYISMLTTRQIVNLCQKRGTMTVERAFNLTDRIRDLVAMTNGSLVYSIDNGSIFLVKN